MAWSQGTGHGSRTGSHARFIYMMWWQSARVTQRRECRGLNLHRKDVSTPTVFHCLFCVPEPSLGRIELGHENDICAPRQFSNSLLENCLLGPHLRELPHIVKVRGRKAAHIRKCLAQIPRDTINDFSAPAMFFLRLADCIANAPIKQSSPYSHAARRSTVCFVSRPLCDLSARRTAHYSLRLEQMPGTRRHPPLVRSGVFPRRLPLPNHPSIGIEDSTLATTEFQPDARPPVSIG